ncbi:MAG: tRNA uridine-5-carboxymethylaminomethyl(34) synthesis GTPase MnmE [Pseudomonadota bacterium]|nr:tRNA uridine-5-carboxymethylaminomethyl(34) synthesis GTPase MnmE [Pseudomonadota bacterium]
MRDSADTIFAQATPPGRSAVAVIRISGPRAFDVPAAFACRGPAPGRFALARLLDRDGTPLDEALLLAMKGPRSSTGEDVLEIHAHGSMAVSAAIMAQLGTLEGFRPAGPGEFTQRMFANGKIDLLGTEALADLIDAETDRQRLQAWRQRDGALHGPIDAWRAALVALSANLEALIDFADEELPVELLDRIGAETRDLAAAIEAVLDDGGEGERVRSGVTVSLAGPVNAGKSTLLNRLAGRPVAIVSSQAGTTRDIVSVRIDLDGLPVTIQDTAGMRDTADLVEAEGVRRAETAAREADIVLIVIDPGAAGWQDELARLGALVTGPHGVILTKRDMLDSDPAGRPPGSLLVSLRDGGPESDLEAVLGLLRRLVTPVNSPDRQSIVTRARHRHALAAAAAALHAAAACDMASAPELAAEEYRRAADSLGRVTGQIDVEELLDSIFSSFCIGK